MWRSKSRWKSASKNNQIATIGLDQLFYFANFLAFCGLKGEKGFIFLWRRAIKLMCPVRPLWALRKKENVA